MASRNSNLTAATMKNLVLDDPNFILKVLLDNECFVKFLNKDSYADREIDYMIQLLNTICTSQKEASILKIWKLMYDCAEHFLVNDIINSIESIHFGDSVINVQKLIEKYIEMWKCILNTCPPEECFPIVKQVIPKLQTIMDLMAGMNINIHSIQGSLRQLSVSCVRYDKALEYTGGKPAKDFRLLPVFPEANDFDPTYTPFLRPIQLEGSYLDVDDYLDVHFRLMREDMVETFRTAIAECKQGITAHNNVIKDVSVSYPPYFTTDGICHTLSLDYPTAIDWARTKKLLPGSLLCLSEDFFKSSLIFVLIVRRLPQSGQHCKLEVVMQSEDCEVSVNQRYSLMETSAYFESYKHVLKALKRFNNNNFPLANYIVKLDYSDNIPEHLRNEKFCLHEKCSGIDDCESCKVFDVLNFEEWPTQEELKVDEYQRKAFQAAITQKLSLIQGPPGTGKTFLGVKIVKALLDNIKNKPIVICCVTNHALDQFLERLIKFTKKIVRLGDQSQMDILLPHKLSTMLRAVRAMRAEGCLYDPDLLSSLDIATTIVKNIVSTTPTQMAGDNFYTLKSISMTLNKLVQSLQLCIQKYMDSAALSEILPKDFLKILCLHDTETVAQLNKNMKKWLNINGDSVLYERWKNKKYPESTLDIKYDKFKCQKDIWLIPLETRFRIFFKWRQKCIMHLCEKISHQKRTYFRFLDEKETYPNFDKVSLLQGADIIGVTMTGAAKFFDSLQFVRPEIFIIEEAAEALESHLISSLLPSTKQLILIGDHEQLRPISATHELSINYNLNISLFERLVKNKCPSSRLVTQFRMRPCIADLLVPHIYESLDSHQSVKEYENIRGTSHNMFFLNHSEPEDDCHSNTSISNKFEVDFIMNLIQHFLQYNYDPTQITVLAMYAEQVRLLQRRIEQSGSQKVLVTTVDNYQGEENDIIIISFVRSNDMGVIGFLKESNRVCVALSRARRGLYCIGNFDMFALKSELFANIKQRLDENENIGRNFPFSCPGHNRIISIKEIEDFDNFLESGCNDKCEFELPCGHLCPNKCHFSDMVHKLYKCKRECTRVVMDSNGLPSPCTRLCYQQCRGRKKKKKLPCGHLANVNVDEPQLALQCFAECEKILACKHTIKVPCFQLRDNFFCTALVEIILKCGHSHFIKCSMKNDLSSFICYELSPSLSPCGHTVKIPCHEYPDEETLLAACKRRCGDLLACGHECQGVCSRCHNIKIHATCVAECEKLLICGHKCKGMCGTPCSRCMCTCRLRCFHKHCSNPCTKPCVQCYDPCVRKCKHQACSQPCYRPCDVGPCDQPCAEMLYCGHRCVGFCGDPCPPLCRVCNPDDLKCKNIETDFFVLLEDCDHVIQVDDLTQYIEEQISCCIWPTCPRCDTMITRNQRFNDQLKDMKHMITDLDVTENLKEVQYLFRTVFKDVSWRFLETERRLDYILLEKVQDEASLLILTSCLNALGQLFVLEKKLESSPMCAYFETLIMWINGHLHLASFQQLEELENMITKLKLCFK